MYVTSIPENAEFDYVIVGSGSAGCALANRLSEDGRHRVLLLEAGGRDDTYKIHVPLMVAHVLNDTRWTWQYVTEPQTHLNGQQTKWARAVLAAPPIKHEFVRGDLACTRGRDDWCQGLGISGQLPFSSAGGLPGRRPRCALWRPHSLHLSHFDLVGCVPGCVRVDVYKVGDD